MIMTILLVMVIMQIMTMSIFTIMMPAAVVMITIMKGIIIIINADNGTEIDTLNFDELAIPPIPVNGSLLFLTTKGMLSAYE